MVATQTYVYLLIFSLFTQYSTSDRDYKGASEDDEDNEAPRISLQEMLEDLHLEEPDSGSDMMTE